jgi:hypothetical protein
LVKKKINYVTNILQIQFSIVCIDYPNPNVIHYNSIYAVIINSYKRVILIICHKNRLVILTHWIWRYTVYKLIDFHYQQQNTLQHEWLWWWRLLLLFVTEHSTESFLSVFATATTLWHFHFPNGTNEDFTAWYKTMQNINYLWKWNVSYDITYNNTFKMTICNNNQLSNHLHYSLNNSFKGKALLFIDTKTSELKGNGVTYIHMMISEYCSPWY